MHLSQITWKNIPKLQMFKSRGDVVESIEIEADKSKAGQFNANIIIFATEIPDDFIEEHNVCICPRYFFIEFDF